MIAVHGQGTFVVGQRIAVYWTIQKQPHERVLLR